MDCLFLPEITIKILIYLPLPEILSFRLISKKAKQIVDNYLKLQNLIIYDSMLPINYKEFYTNKLFDCTHSIRLMNFDSKIDEQLKRSLFTSIKQLKINDELLLEKKNACEILNLFKNLKSLELSSFRLENEDTLILPNLEILTIYFTLFDGNHNQLILNTPKLSKLRFEYFNNQMNLKFIYPETVTYLRINYYHFIVKSCLNLECLICDKIDFVDTDLFNSLSKLKEFHFENEITSFNNLKNQAENMGRKIKIYLRGIEFESIDLNFQNFNDENSRSIIELLYLNYNKTAPIIPFINYLEYEFLEDKFKNIPNDLINKLINLKSIFVNKINDKMNFINFLNHLNSLTWIEIRLKESKIKLDQQFYNEFLIEKFPKLQFLRIKDNNIDSLDFNFLFKLNYLVSIVTNKFLSIHLIENLILDLKYLSLLKCRYLNHKIKISLYRKNEIELSSKNLIILDEKEEKFTNKEELIDFLKILMM